MNDMPADPEILTGREREALRLLSESRPLAEVAAAMQISTDTVVNHLRAVVSKLTFPS